MFSFNDYFLIIIMMFLSSDLLRNPKDNTSQRDYLFYIAIGYVRTKVGQTIFLFIMYDCWIRYLIYTIWCSSFNHNNLHGLIYIVIFSFLWSLSYLSLFLKRKIYVIVNSLVWIPIKKREKIFLGSKKYIFFNGSFTIFYVYICKLLINCFVFVFMWIYFINNLSSWSLSYIAIGIYI